MLGYSEKEDRALFNAYIDHTEEDILIADIEGVIVTVNARLVESWGGVKQDYIGTSCFDTGKNEIYGKNRRVLFDAVLEKQIKVTDSFSNPMPDGHLRHYVVSAFPLPGGDGEVRLVALTRTDITERLHIERRLLESQKLAAVGELSAYLAHELRNPLFAIGGFAKKLRENNALDETTRNRAGIILDEAQRLEATCHNIMSFARPSSAALSSVDVNAVANKTVSLLSIGSRQKFIRFGLELSEEMPRAHGNSDLIQQCLVNLIKNAMEVLCDGGTIRVRTRYAEATVYLEVEDDGPGIPLELQDKVFSPFFSTKEEGTGLGLAMTRKIVNECNGRIFLHSRPGSPTTVSLALQPVLAG